MELLGGESGTTESGVSSSSDSGPEKYVPGLPPSEDVNLRGIECTFRFEA